MVSNSKGEEEEMFPPFISNRVVKRKFLKKEIRININGKLLCGGPF